MNLKLRNILKIIEAESVLDEMDIFREEYLINEGLIKTWPLDKTVSILKSSKIECDKYKDKNVFHVILEKNSPKNLDQILTITNNLGWFPSYSYFISKNITKSSGKFDYDDIENNISNFDFIMIRFESKYDTIIEDIPKFLYHITPRETAIKILNLGLQPKNRSIISTHPERIYLGINEKQLESMIRNNPNSWSKSRDGKWSILKINTRAIPNYFRIYQDPNARKFGVFTLNTIPPKAIEFVKTISINES